MPKAEHWWRTSFVSVFLYYWKVIPRIYTERRVLWQKQRQCRRISFLQNGFLFLIYYQSRMDSGKFYYIALCREYRQLKRGCDYKVFYHRWSDSGNQSFCTIPNYLLDINKLLAFNKTFLKELSGSVSVSSHTAEVLSSNMKITSNAADKIGKSVSSVRNHIQEQRKSVKRWQNW